jgi:predicted pyridoxine 5'-phosphate oxidase superfamily flavin-nucleotide-binding protein
MVKLTQEIKDTMPKGTMYFFVTCSKAVVPNAVPIKALKLLDDETILVSDQYFNKTMKNLQENPQVAISFWGEKGGCQIKGTATVHKGDKIFEDDVAWIKEMNPKLTPKSAVVVKITEVFGLKPGPDAGKKLL